MEEVGQFIVPPLNFADGEEAQNDLREPFRPGGSGADLLKIDQLVADGDEGLQARTPGEHTFDPAQGEAYERTVALRNTQNRRSTVDFSAIFADYPQNTIREMPC